MEIKDKYEGDLTITEPTKIDGMIIGNVSVNNRLLLNGTINGNIQLTRNGTIFIHGTVNGDIYNKGYCNIYGTVNGIIYSHYKDIKIDDGAKINGELNLIDIIRLDDVHPSDLKDSNYEILKREIERKIRKNSEEKIKTRIDVYSSKGNTEPTIYECIYKNIPVKSIEDCDFNMVKL